MNTEIQPDPMRKLAKNIGLMLAMILKPIIKFIFGTIDFITDLRTIFMVQIALFCAGFASLIFFNDIDPGVVIVFGVITAVCLVIAHGISAIPENRHLPKKYHFVNNFWGNMNALALTINIFTWGFGVFTCNHVGLLKNEEIALVIDGKPITSEGWLYVNPFQQKIERIEHNLSLINVPVKGATKDGIELQALVDIQLRRSDNPANWKSPANLNPKLEDVIRKRFEIACSTVTSDQIASSGLKLEFETGRDASPEDTLPKAVQRNGEVVVENIHARFVDK